MKHKKVVWGLMILNAVLAVVLIWKLGGENPARAQGLARSEFIMVPADIPGASSGAVYIVDTRNALMSGFVYDQNRNIIDVMAPIDLGRLFTAAAGGR
jgi:hypothetical protein